MTARRPPAGAIVYVVLCAGAVCYIGGLVSALYRQQAWMAAALGTAIALLTGVTGTLVIDYWVSRKRERRLVRGIEEWMKERARHGDGRRRD